MPYQNGNASDERTPLRLEDVNMTMEQRVQRDKSRRNLFTAMITLLLIATCIFFVIISRTKDDVAENAVLQDKTTAPKALAHLNKAGKTSSKVQPGCESTLLIIRHCEKNGPLSDRDGDQHCSYQGLERAQFIADELFGKSGDTEAKWPIVPSKLYALTPTRKNHYNFREVETLQPLADKYGLNITLEDKYGASVAKDYFKLLQNGEMCGKLALVSWKHLYIGQLARALACGDCPYEYPDTNFDQVWQLKFLYDPLHSPVAMLSSSHEDDNSTRRLKRKSKKHVNQKNGTWFVISTVTQQGFDPLRYSARAGDYNSTGTVKTGGNWAIDDDGI